MKTKKLYSISEVSREMQLPVSTLRFYQRSGLFLPAVKDENNNYCYYSADQLGELELITFLRELNLPIKTISGIIRDAKSRDEIISLLDKHRAKLEKDIAELQYQLKKLSDTADNFRAEALSGWDPPENTVCIKSCEARYFLTVPAEIQPIDSGFAWSLAIRRGTCSLIGSHDHLLAIHSMGGVMPFADGRTHQSYTSVFIETSGKPQTEQLCRTEPPGDYLVIRYRNDAGDRERACALLEDYVRTHECRTAQYIYDGTVNCVLPPVKFEERIFELHLRLIP